jgi:acetolactate synthase-1/2/3 large subunit
MLGELATRGGGRDVGVILMNDRGYGVIRNIQDAQYAGRHAYSNILTPDFALLCAAMGCRTRRVARASASRPPGRGARRAGAAGDRGGHDGDRPFAESFAGPPAAPPVPASARRDPRLPTYAFPA